jgi:hypothetical protein
MTAAKDEARDDARALITALRPTRIERADDVDGADPFFAAGSIDRLCPHGSDDTIFFARKRYNEIALNYRAWPPCVLQNHRCCSARAAPRLFQWAIEPCPTPGCG